MFDAEQYELVDFGGGRKLERFGGQLVDRPCPVATQSRATPELWSQATAKLSRAGEAFRWQVSDSEDAWQLHWEDLNFELKTTDSGQVGVFPEQSVNWQWITKKLKARPSAKVLNLFGYTGGSTLAAARGGAQVVHVDAAKSVVNWARRNAELSGLAEAPIRWIVEDAVRFVAREIKRGNTYDGIILDPPSYGHGPKGESWKLSRDLFELLADCKHLLSKTPVLFLLSCHTPGFGPAELSASLSTCLFGSCGAGVQTRDLSLTTRSGRRLAAGHAAFWP